MNKIIRWILGGVIALVLFLWIVPPFIHWNNFKPQIIEAARKANVDLDIKGDISLTILPAPSVVIDEVTINYNGQNAVTIDRVKARADLISLIQRQPKTSTITLEKPRVYIYKFFDKSVTNSSEKHAAAELPIILASAPSLMPVEQDSAVRVLSNLPFEKLFIHDAGVYFSPTQRIPLIRTDLALSYERGSFHLEGDTNVINQRIGWTLKTTVQGAEPYPLEAVVRYGEDALTLQGNMSQLGQNPLFEGNLAIEVKDFFKHARVMGYESIPLGLKDTTIKGTGRVILGRQKSQLTNYTLMIGGYRALIDALFNAENKQQLQLKINIPDLKTVFALQNKPTADEQGLGSLFSLSLSSPDINQLLQLVNIKSPYSLVDINTDISLAVDPEHLTRSLTLKNLTARLNEGRLQGEVQLASHYNVTSKEEALKKKSAIEMLRSVSASLESPEVWPLLKPFGYGDIKGSASFKGKVTETATHSVVLKDCVLRILGGTFDINGEVSTNATALNSDLHLKIYHGDVASMQRQLGQKSDLPPRVVLNAETDVKASPQAVRLANLKGSLGAGAQPLQIAGNVDVALGQIPHIKTDLRLTKGRLDSLLAEAKDAEIQMAEDATISVGGIEVPLELVSYGRRAPSASTPSRTASASSRWSTDPLDWSGLSKFTAALNLQGDGLIYKNFSLDDAVLVVRVDKGMLIIDQGKMRTAGGNVDIKGHVDGTAQRVVFSADGRDLQIAQLAQSDTIKGGLSFDISINSQGKSQRDLVRSLGGQAAFKVHHGSVRGVDLKEVSTLLKNVVNPLSIIKLLTGGGRGTTHVAYLGGTFQIRNGVARTNDLTLTADASQGKGEGAIDLERWWLNLMLQLRLLEHPKLPPIAVKVTGPIDQPQTQIDTDALKAMLVPSKIQDMVGGLVDTGKSIAQGDGKKVLENIAKAPLDAAKMLGELFGG